MQVDVNVKAGLPDALGSWPRTGGSSGHLELQSEPQGLWLQAFAPLPVEHLHFVLPQLYIPR